jgi:peptidyl-dipeptidase A
MTIMRLPALTALAILLATPSFGQDRDHVKTPVLRAQTAKPAFAAPAITPPPATARVRTATEAEDFIAKVEADLVSQNEYANRIEWIAANFITGDSSWLMAKVSAERAALAVGRAKTAATFDGVAVDPVTRRKLELLKRAFPLPPPDRPGAAEELANIEVRLDTAYTTGKVTYQGKELTLDDITDIMRTERDPSMLKTLWERWHAIARPMRDEYARLVRLANEGARALGYAETGVLWRSWYDMPANDFAKTVEGLWLRLAPIYQNLHCYTRARLNEKYGDAVQPRIGPIRADLLGDMWAQSWSNVHDLLAPKNADLGYDLTQALVQHDYDATKLVKTAANFYSSLGFAELPPTFWTRSLFVRPRDREVDCEASAWNIDSKDDVRIKACLRVNADDFYTAHHELGHNMYTLAYQDQPALFQNGANDGFHEAIGDFIGLSSVTPTYLQQIGLIEKAPGAEADISYLLRMALEKIAFLPFGYIVDKWRWQVFAGETMPEHYNEEWWALRRKYQGVVPPGVRPADAFDPGAKAHIASNIPYMAYFLATIYQFQFHRAACRIAGWNGPLNRCSIYGNKEVGTRLQAMLRLGASKPWPEALAAFTGERDLDANAVIDYFAPLDRWLTAQNKDEMCGW